tara:strand:- start:188 stop:964 length:777 start_codon:yes stop_codon:yes gene_type:complete
MSTFEQIEVAVADKRVSYKDLVEAIYADKANTDRMAEIFDRIALSEADPKVLRKKYRNEQVKQHGDDKAAIKEAMTAYDQKHKTKRVPPPPRVWTEEDKVRTKAKNAFVKNKEREEGDDVTLAELKLLRKKWRKEFNEKHPVPEPVVEAPKDLEFDEKPPVPEPVVEAPNGLTKEFDEEPEYEEPEDDEPEDEEPEDEEPEDEESEDEEPPVPEPVVEAKKGLTKADKVLYKALQSKKGTHTEEERKQYKALKAKAKA